MAIGKSFFLCGLRFLEERVISEDEEKKAVPVKGFGGCGSIWVNHLLSGNLRKTYKRNACGKGNQWLIKETNGFIRP